MKKRLLALFIMLSLAATFVFPAFAEGTLQGSGSQNDPVIVSSATNLKEVLEATKLSDLFSNSTDNTIYIKLDADITLGSDFVGDETTTGVLFTIGLEADQTINLDLAGHTLSSESKSHLFLIEDGHLNITNVVAEEPLPATSTEGTTSTKTEGIISTTNGYVFRVFGNRDWEHGETSDPTPTVTIGKDVKISSVDGTGAYVAGNKATLNVSGKVESTNYFAICGNGLYDEDSNTNYGDTVINIYDGAVITSQTAPAIYHPQVGGKLTIEGGTITGTTGIEMRAGTLTVKDGTITGTADTYTVNPNGNGSTTEGAGIAVAQHTTKEPIDVTVSGGTIKGYTAFSATNPQGNDATDIANVVIKLNGGTFTSTGTNGHDLLVIGNNKATLAKAAVLTNNKLCTSYGTGAPGEVTLENNDAGIGFTAGGSEVKISYTDGSTTQTIIIENDEGNIDFSSDTYANIDTTNANLIKAVASAVIYSGASKVIDLPSNETTGTKESELITEIRKANPTIGFYKSLSGSITASTN